MDQPTITFSGEAALPDWSAFQANSYLARVDWPLASVVVRLPEGAKQKPTVFWRDTVLEAAKKGLVDGERVVTVTDWPKPVLWRDSLGRPVDVENIDNQYAFNILVMYLLSQGRRGYSRQRVQEDELVQKLRETVLHGRDPNEADRQRAIEYNRLNAAAGLTYRAPVEFDDILEAIFQTKVPKR